MPEPCEPQPIPCIWIVSGGVGASAEQVVHTILAQFPDCPLSVVTRSSVRQPEQVMEALRGAREAGALVVHTLVEGRLRALLVEQARLMGVPEVDLMGPVIEWVSRACGRPPLEQPGLYRRLNRDYFERVAAIDFAMAHDDGKNMGEWEQAEIILVGVSRAGKTPLSLYLAVLGWKVANLPLVPGMALPDELFERHRAKMLGLKIDPEQLLVYRRQRQARLGVSGPSSYVDLEAIQQEVQAANRLFRQAGLEVVDMTDKTIEMAADEILRRTARERGGGFG